MATGNTRDLIQHLVEISSGLSLVNRLLFVLRPSICPFSDILGLIQENSTVYDIGCGRGVLMALLDKYKNPRRLSGHDISPDVIGDAKKISGRWLTSQSCVDLRCLGREDKPDLRGYRYITMIDVLHHVPQDAQWHFLQNIYHSMDNGSYLLLKDIDGESPLRYMNRLHDLVVAREVGHERPAGEVAHQLEAMGLQVKKLLRKIVLWYPHYLILARKIV